jgi:hypothetical protein
MTPADELRTAAEKLRSLVTFLGDCRGPWKVGTPPSGYPQSISNVGVPYLVADTHEDPSVPVFTIAPYIAAMHPGVGLALVKWLESWVGIDFNEHAAMAGDLAHALAVARQINGSQS